MTDDQVSGRLDPTHPMYETKLTRRQSIAHLLEPDEVIDWDVEARCLEDSEPQLRPLGEGYLVLTDWRLFFVAQGDPTPIIVRFDDGTVTKVKIMRKRRLTCHVRIVLTDGTSLTFHTGRQTADLLRQLILLNR